MKLPFETWIENSHFSVDAEYLLKNSVICYKAGSPAAALLMGYLGFLVILKDRMMRGTKPNLYPQQTWDSQLKHLLNEDKWEDAIFSAVMQQEKINNQKVRVMDPVFVINDNLRAQIRYWKDRRNDCAHHKDNAIIISHVETFWAFLQSNLQKITLEGGKATLLNKIEKHFDTTYTPAGADVTPLVREIKGAVEKSELLSFWKELMEVATNLLDYTNETEIIDAILKLDDESLSDSLLNYLKKDEYLFNAYLSACPSVVIRLGLDSQEIRELWKKKLNKVNNPIGIYAAMLRNNLIPADEVNTANEHVANFYKYTNDMHDHLILASHGFGDALYHNLFVKHNASDYQYWKFMNHHSDLYIQYIGSYPLKDDVVTILCQELGKTTWSPQFLQNAIDYFFKKNGEKKKEFIEKALKLGLNLPRPIEELHV